MSGTIWDTVAALGLAGAVCAVLISIRAHRMVVTAVADLNQRRGELSRQYDQLCRGIQIAAGQDVPQPHGLRAADGS